MKILHIIDTSEPLGLTNKICAAFGETHSKTLK